MLLERLDGRSPAKVVGARDFHDIGYLRDLLFTVFTALDVGQRRMGARPPLPYPTLPDPTLVVYMPDCLNLGTNDICMHLYDDHPLLEQTRQTRFWRLSHWNSISKMTASVAKQGSHSFDITCCPV